MAPRNNRYIPLPQLIADEPVVRELLEDLRVAYENVLNAYPEKHEGKTVQYIDAAMAVHNLHRLALRHVIDDSGLPVVESMGWLRIMRDTFSNAIERDIEQLRQKAEGVKQRHGR